MAIGPDRIQLLKQESSSFGGDSADETDYPAPIAAQEDAIECAGVYLQDAGARDENVWIERNGNDLRFRDVSNPTPVTLTTLMSGGGISEATHENLDTLTHRIAETSYLEVTRSSGQVTSVIVWETAAKLKKIRETTITRSGGQVSTFVEKHYDASGALITGQTITNTVTRSGGQVASIDAVQS